MKYSVIIWCFFLASCSDMDATDCEFAEWDKIGKKQAQQGKSDEEFRKHFNECNQYGIKANREQYRKGWAIGIVDYCTIENGYTAGKTNSYEGVCPTDLEPDFLKGYALGKEVYEISKKLRVKEHEKRKIQITINSKERKERRGEISSDELDILNRAREQQVIVEKELTEISKELQELDNNNKTTLRSF